MKIKNNKFSLTKKERDILVKAYNLLFDMSFFALDEELEEHLKINLDSAHIILDVLLSNNIEVEKER